MAIEPVALWNKLIKSHVKSFNKALRSNDQGGMTSQVMELTKCLDARNSDEIRNSATWALELISDMDPSLVRGALPAVKEMLYDFNHFTCLHALQIMQNVADYESTLIREYITDIGKLLDHNFNQIRRAASRLLLIVVNKSPGLIAHNAGVIEALREAERDYDEQTKARAREILARLQTL